MRYGKAFHQGSCQLIFHRGCHPSHGGNGDGNAYVRVRSSRGSSYRGKFKYKILIRFTFFAILPGPQARDNNDDDERREHIFMTVKREEELCDSK